MNNVSAIVELAKCVSDLKDAVNNISVTGDRPSVLLKQEAFLDIFQTYQEVPLTSGDGKLTEAILCNVIFHAVVYDHELGNS